LYLRDFIEELLNEAKWLRKISSFMVSNVSSGKTQVVREYVD
jgi:hypothetical protein